MIKSAIHNALRTESARLGIQHRRCLSRDRRPTCGQVAHQVILSGHLSEWRRALARRQATVPVNTASSATQISSKTLTPTTISSKLEASNLALSALLVTSRTCSIAPPSCHIRTVPSTRTPVETKGAATRPRNTAVTAGSSRARNRAWQRPI